MKMTGQDAFRFGMVGLGVVLLVLVTLGIYPTSLPKALSTCSTDNVQISNLSLYQEGSSTVKISGQLRHDCSKAVGVEVEWTVFYKDGSIAFIQKLYPASDSNIPPNQNFSFTMYHGISGEPGQFTLKPVSIEEWKD